MTNATVNRELAFVRRASDFARRAGKLLDAQGVPTERAARIETVDDFEARNDCHRQCHHGW